MKKNKNYTSKAIEPEWIFSLHGRYEIFDCENTNRKNTEGRVHVIEWMKEARGVSFVESSYDMCSGIGYKVSPYKGSSYCQEIAGHFVMVRDNRTNHLYYARSMQWITDNLADLKNNNEAIRLGFDGIEEIDKKIVSILLNVLEINPSDEHWVGVFKDAREKVFGGYSRKYNLGKAKDELSELKKEVKSGFYQNSIYS